MKIVTWLVGWSVSQLVHLFRHSLVKGTLLINQLSYLNLLSYDVSEPEGNIPPRIEHSIPNVNARAGSPTDLVCAAQGFPPPSYRSVRSKL
jgi:hypothetical protein